MSNEKILALDIGQAHIKGICKGKKSEDCHFMLDTPLGSYYDGRLTNVALIADVIRDEMVKHKRRANYMAVSVNSSACIIRQFRIPKLTEEEEIRGALELQISETLSTILDSHALSYSVYQENDEMMTGILVLMPHDLISTYVELAAMLELMPAYMDIHPNAAAKIYQEQLIKEIQEETAILIDFGESSTSLTLTRDGKVLFNRFVPGGSNMVDEMLERELGLDKPQALECRMGAYSQFGISDEDMRKYVRLSCMRIEDEIRQVVDYFSYNKLEGRIGAIVLHGNGAKLNHFYEHLKNENAIPVVLVDPEIIPFINVEGALLHRGKKVKENILTKNIKLPGFRRNKKAKG
jgi:type IV pilus assembly protein PilM